MNLADAGRIAVRILQHLINKAHLLDSVANDEIGVLSGVATEHLLKFPTLVQRLKTLERATFLLVFICVGLVQIGPVEHVHILAVATDEGRVSSYRYSDYFDRPLSFMGLPFSSSFTVLA